jgi:hypothetical protein
VESRPLHKSDDAVTNQIGKKVGNMESIEHEIRDVKRMEFFKNPMGDASDSRK